MPCLGDSEDTHSYDSIRAVIFAMGASRLPAIRVIDRIGILLRAAACTLPIGNTGVAHILACCAVSIRAASHDDTAYLPKPASCQVQVVGPLVDMHAARRRKQATLAIPQ